MDECATALEQWCDGLCTVATGAPAGRLPASINGRHGGRPLLSPSNARYVLTEYTLSPLLKSSGTPALSFSRPYGTHPYFQCGAPSDESLGYFRMPLRGTNPLLESSGTAPIGECSGGMGKYTCPWVRRGGSHRHGQVYLPAESPILIDTGKCTCPCHPDRSGLRVVLGVTNGRQGRRPLHR